VVRALTALIRFRNSHPAFEGSLTCSGNAASIEMSWAHDGDEAVLRASLADGSAEVTWTENGTSRSAPLAALP
jgi:sucrose phosphorylase